MRGALRAAAVDRFEVVLVFQKVLRALAHRAQQLDDRLSHGGLERAVALAAELLLDLFQRLARRDGIDAHKVLHALLACSAADLAAGVGDGAFEFAHDILGLIGQKNIAVRVGIGL